jgi:hypothetical protein
LFPGSFFPVEGKRKKKSNKMKNINNKTADSVCMWGFKERVGEEGVKEKRGKSEARERKEK